MNTPTIYRTKHIRVFGMAVVKIEYSFQKESEGVFSFKVKMTNAANLDPNTFILIAQGNVSNDNDKLAIENVKSLLRTLESQTELTESIL